MKRLIGKGAMGKIYLARDPKLGRDVAIKVLNSQSANRGVRERFRLEARAIAALKHPNIIELYDYSGEQADDLFLVMEFIPGRTLHDHIVERGPMSEVTALCIGHELALALEHSHRHKVVHRDLKPENVLLHEGRVVLTDFGIVKQVASEGVLGSNDLSLSTQILGTPGFMAPEQIEGRGVTAQTDIFALGALLYNLTTGEMPFEGDNIGSIAANIRKGRYLDPRTFAPLLSRGLCKLVDDCLAPKQRRRLTSADAARERLLDVLRAHGITEVRHEILDYEQNPATHAIEQRERGLDVMTRDLKLAIKDRDEPRVQAIVQRMQLIAPLGNRMNEVTGIHFDQRQRPRLTRELLRVRRLPWVAGGVLLGMALGAALSLTALAMGMIPTWVMVWFERLADSLGMGY